MSKAILNDIARHGYEFTGDGRVFVPKAGIAIGGVFSYEHWRKGELLSADETKNIIVDQGLNHTLNVLGNGATQVNPWYVGIFEGNYTPVAGDTAATFPTNAVECTAYTEAGRPEFVEVASTAKSLTNLASKAVFTFNATKTIYGGFLVSVATKGSGTGTLLAASRASVSKNVITDDQLLIGYTLTIASA